APRSRSFPEQNRADPSNCDRMRKPDFHDVVPTVAEWSSLTRSPFLSTLARWEAGEVLVSTTGLEFAFTEAGKEMKSTIMSFWLLTVSVGNLWVSWITKLAGAGETSASVSAIKSW
ncbi:MAG: POT family MFS transporter, partial [Nitrospira sp.]|nr:POT family MFS transporter [Nitrospira sp.]